MDPTTIKELRLLDGTIIHLMWSAQLALVLITDLPDGPALVGGVMLWDPQTRLYASTHYVFQVASPREAWEICTPTPDLLTAVARALYGQPTP